MSKNKCNLNYLVYKVIIINSYRIYHIKLIVINQLTINLHSVTDLFADNNVAFDADFIIEPRVGYEVTSDFTINSTPTCTGSNIELTNISSPIVESRFYNQKVFDNYFYGDPDDTYIDGNTVNTKKCNYYEYNPR